MGQLLPPDLGGTFLNLFSLFWERSGCLPAPSPSAACLNILVFLSHPCLANQRSSSWKVGILPACCFQCAASLQKKGTLVLITPPFSAVRICPHSWWVSSKKNKYFLNISWSWNYIRGHVEESTEGMSLFVSDLHYCKLPSCTKTGLTCCSLAGLHLVLSCSWVPPPQSSSTATFWECGLNGKSSQLDVQEYGSYSCLSLLCRLLISAECFWQSWMKGLEI